MNMTFLPVNSNLCGILIVKSDEQHIAYERFCKCNQLKLLLLPKQLDQQDQFLFAPKETFYFI